MLFLYSTRPSHCECQYCNRNDGKSRDLAAYLNPTPLTKDSSLVASTVDIDQIHCIVDGKIMLDFTPEIETIEIKGKGWYHTYATPCHTKDANYINMRENTEGSHKGQYMFSIDFS